MVILNSLRGQAATYFQDMLPDALEHFNHVIVLTHISSFRESCWHEEAISADDWLPHFSCKAVGDVLVKFMEGSPDKQMTVFCGHIHSSGKCKVLPNLEVKTGAAKYGSPMIQKIVRLGQQRKFDIKSL